MIWFALGLMIGNFMGILLMGIFGARRMDGRHNDYNTAAYNNDEDLQIAERLKT